MFFWNSLAFLLIQQMLAIWSLVPLPFLKPAQTSGSSRFTYCWSLTWRILSITLLVCEMSATVQYICKYMCVCVCVYIYTCIYIHTYIHLYLLTVLRKISKTWKKNVHFDWLKTWSWQSLRDWSLERQRICNCPYRQVLSLGTSEGNHIFPTGILSSLYSGASQWSNIFKLYHLKNLTSVEHKSKLAFSRIF